MTRPSDPDSLPSGDHVPQDYQSYLMHRAAVELLQASPALVQRAQVTLERWIAAGDGRSDTLFDQWRLILAERNWPAALEDSEAGRQRRQASPLATLLPHEARLEIIERVRKLKDAGALKAKRLCGFSAEEAISALHEYAAGQFVSEEELDRTLGVPPAHGRGEKL